MLLSTLSPTAAAAAPTPTATPAPARAPNVFGSPSPSPSPAPSPSPRAGATSTPTEVGSAIRADDIEAAVDWQSYVPTDVADHLATMDRAARDSNCGVPWQLLASIARVESDFGRNMATSSAGAVGYGQFLPSSWDAYGSEGNVYDYHDVLPAIATYLCQAGLERDPRSALFAYNHADWYVDLVLDLAVRYDRMAPGAPTPEVLDVGPANQQSTSMHYAAGRDVRQQARPRTIDNSERWLGVPWHGRTPGQPVGRSLVADTLGMLAGGFGLKSSPQGATATSDDLGALQEGAWDHGLLALPGEGQQWTVSEVRRDVQRGEPVVVFVDSHGLPGHPQDENLGEQPLVLIGTTPTGLIYSDPTFSSSLGYGLELSDDDLMHYWDGALQPRQALAFTRQPPVASAHVAQAVAPVPITRVQLPVSTRTAVAPTDVPTQTPLPVSPPAPTAIAREPAPREPVEAARRSGTDFDGGVGLIVVGLAFMWWRARRPV